jgi:hypothetical protein
MKQAATHRRVRGFLMMEVVLALGIFAIAATSLAVALARTSDAAQMAQRRIQINRILESALNEAISLPVLEVGSETISLKEEIGGAPVEIDTTVELIEDMENLDGQLLQEMYRVKVTANWYENGEWMEETAESWRYGRFYQP